MLAAGGFWGVSWLASRLAANDAAPGSSDHPSPTAHVSDWSPEDLPWTDPDPAVQLALDKGYGNALLPSAIYERVLPSVVCVTARMRYGYSTGSGFIVTESGYVVTNYHVIEEGTSIQIMLLTDDSTYSARVVGFDETFDLAVLKFEAEGLIPAALGDSDQLSVGDPVYAIGNPMGHLYGSMTEGIVSALGRDDVMDDGGLGMIQTSAPLNSGNSGGPLVDTWGRVVGITSAKITGVEDDTVIEGLGLAIPTTDLLPFVNRILATGKSWRPAIGISCRVTSQDGQTGILVASVQKDAPAYEAGLRIDDFIIAANGQRVTSLAALRRVLYDTGVDGTVNCTVLRDGEELEIAFALIDSLEE